MRNSQKGIASVVILFTAGILALFAIGILDIGIIGIKVNKARQSLDTCSIQLGKQIIKTNNIEEHCNQDYFNECFNIFSEDRYDISCIDFDTTCDNQNICKRKLEITSTYQPHNTDKSESVEILINEENHEVNIIDAAVILLLDFSGSMRGNRIRQLKSAVRDFINANYNLSYSVVLYNSNIIGSLNIGKGLNHNQTALSIVNSTSSGGGTNFVIPLQEAVRQIRNTNHEVYYILLISDGSPNEGVNPSNTFVLNNIMNINDDFCLISTSQNPCITIFTLGVDNANTDILKSLSGNAISQDPGNYLYEVSANQTAEAFNAIIEEIMCRIGPVQASEGLYVFNELDILEENIDYILDNQNKILKFYDEEPFNICTNMLNNNSNITLRWGNPLLVVRE